MTDLNLKTFNKLYPMMIRKYSDLIIDQNASEKDKINSIILKLNALGKLSNDVVRDWNTVYQWAMNDGLTTDVNNKLEDMYAKGKFDTILNTVVTKMGDLTTLTTPQKDTIVNSINSLQNEVTTNTTQLVDNATHVKHPPTPLVAAKGDGVTDDTVNLRALNDYLYNLPNVTQTQPYASENSMVMNLSKGVYKVTGNRIFGSPLVQGVHGNNQYPKKFIIEGHGATILWTPSTVDDMLFYFDETLYNPVIKNLNIFVSMPQGFTTAGIVFKYWSGYINSVLEANASKTYLENCTVEGQGGNIKNIIYTTGYGMCDQAKVTNCRFQYFQTIFKSDNPESVNWNFDHCSLFANNPNAIYFDVSAMYDNFVVDTCSFSVKPNETLLKAIAKDDISRDTYHNFIFRSNRIESYCNDGDNFTICDMDFGHLKMDNTYSISGPSGSFNQYVKVKGRANADFDNVQFANLHLYAPEQVAPYTGQLHPIAIHLKDCTYMSYKLYSTNGTTVRDILAALGDVNMFRGIQFENCQKYGEFSSLDYTLFNPGVITKPPIRQEKSFRIANDNVGLGFNIPIPPYAGITEINLCEFPVLPYKRIKIYFGTGAAQLTLIKDNINWDYYGKSKLNIFKGQAVMYDSNLDNQVIKIVFLDDSNVEHSDVSTEVEIKYINPNYKLMSWDGTIKTVIKEDTSVINAGLTTYRPPTPKLGQPWFDTTLNKPIWCKQVSPSIWVDATGVTV